MYLAKRNRSEKSKPKIYETNGSAPGGVKKHQPPDARLFQQTGPGKTGKTMAQHPGTNASAIIV